jgi:hypothetical protein
MKNNTKHQKASAPEAPERPKLDRFRKSKAGRCHVNLTLDSDVWEEAKQNCWGLEISASELINGFLIAWNGGRTKARAEGAE